MKRKYILIFVVAVLVTGLLAGCKDEADETAAQDNIPIEATSQGEKEEVPPQAADLDAMAISQEIEDYTEVTETIPIDKDTRPEQSVTADGSSELTVNNPYFYDKEEIFLQAKAKYPDGHFNGGLVEKVVDIDVDILQTYENGSVYKFTVGIDEDDVCFEEGWLNHYFYVTEDKIYIVPSSINIPSEGLVFNFNDDSNSLTEMFDTDKKLIEWSTIVCQEDEMVEDQESYYRSITKSGNQITYYAYSLKANGDVWWSLYYTWEEGRGLISCGFRKGPGEGYDLTLYDIEEKEPKQVSGSI